MTAETITRSTSRPNRPPALAAPQPGLARAAGIMYVALFGLGMFAPIVLEQLVVPGDAAATAAALTGARLLFGASLLAWVVIAAVDVAVAVVLYLLLAPAGRAASLTAAGFRLVYTAVLGSLLVLLFHAWKLLGLPGGPGQAGDGQHAAALAALEEFATGFQLALVLFGVHLALLGVVLYRSRWAPRVLSVALVAAGFGYAVNSLASLLLGYGGAISMILMVPAVLGELGLTVWLLVKGAAPRKC